MVVIQAVDRDSLSSFSLKKWTDLFNHLKREYPERGEEAGRSVTKGNTEAKQTTLTLAFDYGTPYFGLIAQNI